MLTSLVKPLLSSPKLFLAILGLGTRSISLLHVIFVNSLGLSLRTFHLFELFWH